MSGLSPLHFGMIQSLREELVDLCAHLVAYTGAGVGMLIHDQSCRWVLSIDGDVIDQSAWANSTDFSCTWFVLLV